MPRKRPPREVWQDLRLTVFKRDHWCCVRCGQEVAVDTAHVDHIKSGKLADNSLKNLRTLCRRCHVLRIDRRHRGMIGAALRDGIIGPNYREEMWEG